MKNPLKKTDFSVQVKVAETDGGITIVEPPMSLREQLRRAHPTVDGLTYEVLTGKISEEEYRQHINED
jgi:hypothetical protein